MKKILVIGDSCLDVFIKGTVNRLCPEAPVPVLNPTSKTINQGMAGNLEANLRTLGPDNEIVFITNTCSITKTRYVDTASGYILLRVDENDKIKDPLTLESLYKTLLAIDMSLKDFHSIVISDYDKGYLPIDNLESIISCIKQHTDAIIFMDTKKILGNWSKQVDIVKINSKEYQEQLKYHYHPEDYCKTLIVTLGAKGSQIVKGDHVVHVEGKRVEVMDVSGAGDTYLAALVTIYVNNDLIQGAMRYANFAAAVAVSKHGVVTVKNTEVEV